MAKASILLIFISVFIALEARAEVWQPMVAPEFTVTTTKVDLRSKGDKLQLAENRVRFLSKWRPKAIEWCKQDPECLQVSDELWFTIHFRDGSFIAVTPDHGVFELKMPWKPLEDWRDHVKRVQRFVFDLATEVELEPRDDVGMGHITFELKSTFGEDIFLLRQFLADRFNHPELAMGVLEQDFSNSIPLAMMKRTDLLAKLIEDVDHGRITDMNEMIKRTKECLSFKQHEIEFDDDSFEDRAMRAQKSAEAFNLLADLKIARIAFLKTQTEPIPLIDVLAGRESLPPSEAAARFESYVEQTKREISKYWRFLPQEWKLNPEVRRVMRSETSLSMMDLPVGSGRPFVPPARTAIIVDPRISLEDRLRETRSAKEMIQTLKEYISLATSTTDLFRAKQVRRTILAQEMIVHFQMMNPTEAERRAFARYQRDPSDPISLMQRCKDLLEGWRN